jgi:tRNA (guanosine-2'-O-)-methyltransferase
MDAGRQEENPGLADPAVNAPEETFGVRDAEVARALETYGRKLTPERRALLRGLADRRTRHFTLVMEDLKDPHNISAVIRTSEVFGLQDVHVINEVNPYRITRSVLKGSYKWLDIHCHNRRRECFESLKAKGYRIAVASTNHSESLFDLDLSIPTAFYLGSETMGNHPDTLAAADVRFRIPQQGLTESLNVSVCAGVIIATLDRFLREEGREKYALAPEEKAALLATFYERSAVGVDRNSPVRYID